MKNLNLFLLLFTFLLAGCFETSNPASSAQMGTRWPRSGLRKKSTQKRMVAPPQVFTDAVFAYRKRFNQWPYPLTAASADKAFKEEYKRFIDQGIETMNVTYASQDTMLIDFVYSMDKHAAYIGSKDKYILSSIVGKYVFVSDSTLKIFNILIGKDLKKLN